MGNLESMNSLKMIHDFFMKSDSYYKCLQGYCYTPLEIRKKCREIYQEPQIGANSSLYQLKI